jgi:hypothetical protein
MQNKVFDWEDTDLDPVEGWCRFTLDYEIEIFTNNEWLSIEEYDKRTETEQLEQITEPIRKKRRRSRL